MSWPPPTANFSIQTQSPELPDSNASQPTTLSIAPDLNVTSELDNLEPNEET